MVVSALRSAVSGGIVDTRSAVDALPQAMEISRAGGGPFFGERDTRCGIYGDDCLGSRGDCDASDDRSDSGYERADRAKGKHRTGVVEEAARPARDLCQLCRATQSA